MSDLAISNLLPVAQTVGAPRKPDDPAHVKDAAQQFEALLLGQMLRTAREGSGGWLGSGGDPAGESATDFAEQQFAKVLAQQGGLGLGSMISAALARKS